MVSKTQCECKCTNHAAYSSSGTGLKTCASSSSSDPSALVSVPCLTSSPSNDCRIRCDLAAKIEFWFQSISADVGPVVFAIRLDGFWSNVKCAGPERARDKADPTGPSSPKLPAQHQSSYSPSFAAAGTTIGQAQCLSSHEVGLWPQP